MINPEGFVAKLETRSPSITSIWSKVAIDFETIVGILAEEAPSLGGCGRGPMITSHIERNTTVATLPSGSRTQQAAGAKLSRDNHFEIKQVSTVEGANGKLRLGEETQRGHAMIRVLANQRAPDLAMPSAYNFPRPKIPFILGVAA